MKKKLLAILLIAICCTALFAADVAIAVRLNPVVDKDGFRLDLGSVYLQTSMSADYAGGYGKVAFNFAPLYGKNGLALEGGVWFKPEEKDEKVKEKYTLGFQTQFVTNGGGYIAPTDSYCFAKVDLADAKDKKGNMSLEIGSTIPSDFNYKNNKYYVDLKSNFFKNKDWNDSYVGHIDAKAKVSFNNKQIVAEKILTEASFSPSAGPFQRLEKMSNQSFAGNQYSYGNGDSAMLEDTFIDDYYNATTKFILHSEHRVFKIAEKYVYDIDNKAEDNGFFGSFYIKDLPLEGKFKEIKNSNDATFITAKAEVGLNGVDAEFGLHTYSNYKSKTKNRLDFATNAQFEIYRENGKVQFNVPYAIAELYEVVNNKTKEIGKIGIKNIRTYVEYVNNLENAEHNGVFLTYDTELKNVGASSSEVGFHFGFDGKEYFKDWKVFDYTNIAY